MQTRVPYDDARRSLVKSGAQPNGLDCDATWRWCVWGGGGRETTQVITSNWSVNGSGYKPHLYTNVTGVTWHDPQSHTASSKAGC